VSGEEGEKSHAPTAEGLSAYAEGARSRHHALACEPRPLSISP